MSIYLGEKIKAERKKKDLLQKDLCCEGITKSTISKIEGNTLIPSLQQLEQICKILKIDLFELFLYENKAYSINEDNPSVDINIQKETNIEEDFTNIKDLYENKEFFRIIELYTLPSQCIYFSEAYHAGMSYFAISEFLSAQKYLKRTISLFKNLDHNDKNLYSENLANCFNTLGKICFIKKDYNKTLHYFFKAKITLESYLLTHTELYVTIINNIGSIYCFMSEYYKSIGVLEIHLKKKISQQYFSKLASIHLSLNIAYFKTYNFEKSISHIKKAIFFFNYIEQYLDEGECYLNYINALRYYGNFTEAFNILEYALKTYNLGKLKDSFFVQQLVLFYNVGDFKSILKYHNYIDLKNTRERSIKEYYFIMAHIEFIYNNYKKSHSYYNKCINYFIKNHLYLDLSVAYNDLGVMLNSEEFLQKSLEYRNLYHTLKQKPLRTNVTLDLSPNIVLMNNGKSF